MPAIYNKVFKNRVLGYKKSPARTRLFNNLSKKVIMASKSTITIIPSMEASSPRTLREEGISHGSPPASPAASPRMIRYVKLQKLPSENRKENTPDLFLPLTV